MSNGTYRLRLPPEIIRMIAIYLDLVDLFRMQHWNDTFNTITSDILFYTEYFSHNYPGTAVKVIYKYRHAIPDWEQIVKRLYKNEFEYVFYFLVNESKKVYGLPGSVPSITGCEMEKLGCDLGKIFCPLFLDLEHRPTVLTMEVISKRMLKARHDYPEKAQTQMWHCFEDFIFSRFQEALGLEIYDFKDMQSIDYWLDKLDYASKENYPRLEQATVAHLISSSIKNITVGSIDFSYGIELVKRLLPKLEDMADIADKSCFVDRAKTDCLSSVSSLYDVLLKEIIGKRRRNNGVFFKEFVSRFLFFLSLLVHKQDCLKELEIFKNCLKWRFVVPEGDWRSRDSYAQKICMVDDTVRDIFYKDGFFLTDHCLQDITNSLKCDCSATFLKACEKYLFSNPYVSSDSKILSPAREAYRHVKSFMSDSTATNIYGIAVYHKSLLITSSNDVVQKDIETGIIQRKFIAHSGQIQNILVVNGSTMITSAWDDMIIVWDLITGSISKRIWLEGSNKLPTSIQVKSDTLFVCGFDSKVRLVNLITGKVAVTINLNIEANSIVVNEESFIVAKRGAIYNIEKYSISTRSLRLGYVGHESTVYTLFLWNTMLFSGSADTQIIGWNEETGEIIRIYYGHKSPVRLVAIYDNYLVSSAHLTVLVKWNIDDGRAVEVFPDGHRNLVLSFAFDQGSLYSGGLDAAAIRWNFTNVSVLFTYGGRNIKLRSVVPWKNYVIASGDSMELRVLDKSQNSIFPHQVMSGHSDDGVVCLILHGDILFSGGGDKTIRSRNLTNFVDLRVYYGHTDTVSALSLDDRFIYSGSYDYSVKRWNITSGAIDKEYNGHVQAIVSIQNGIDFLISASFGTSVLLWDKEAASIITTIDYFKDVYTTIIFNDFIIVGSSGLDVILLSTLEVLASREETSPCYSIVANFNRLYTGHGDRSIYGRDLNTLVVLESFQGHKDYVMSLCLDDAGILFSTGFDGTVKKWNMASRKVSFSYENRNGSVTSLAAMNGMLFLGTRQGAIDLFDIRTAYIIESKTIHRSVVTSISHYDGRIYSSGLDGVVYELNLEDSSGFHLFYEAESLPVTSIAATMLNLILVNNQNQIVILTRNNSSGIVRILHSPIPLITLASNEQIIFGGSKTGSIVAWSVSSSQVLFTLEDHTSQVNSLLVQGSSLFSASNDKTIIKWSLEQKTAQDVFQRLSASELGHLGPVNAISLCGSTLYSAGSDLTTRRWNIKTGRHEDVYFGATRSVTTVVCYNGSVFSGSEDFSVLMYSPVLPAEMEHLASTRVSSSSKRRLRTIVASRSNSLDLEATPIGLLLAGIIASVMFVLAVFACLLYFSGYLKADSTPKQSGTTQDISNYSADLDTVVNTVVGISKHAAYLVASSNFAIIKKIALGGGGEIFIARVMNAFLDEKVGTLVIQKKVFIRSHTAEEAFYQEVGIMIMLSTFPNFCRIIGYMDNPASMILQYYPDGSLQDYIKQYTLGRGVITKIVKELSAALNIMHKNYLAHCDIKSQNILIDLEDGVPTCYLTDFGITQVLSDKILATRLFNVINIRGLSTFYAAPEALSCFKNKYFNGVDFKKFDVYSLACVVLELLTRKTPWA